MHESVLSLPAGHTGRITQLCLSPTGSMLVSASADGTARLWDVRLQQPGKGGGGGSVVGSHARNASAVIHAGQGPLTALALDAARMQVIATSHHGCMYA